MKLKSKEQIESEIKKIMDRWGENNLKPMLSSYRTETIEDADATIRALCWCKSEDDPQI